MPLFDFSETLAQWRSTIRDAANQQWLAVCCLCREHDDEDEEQERALRRKLVEEAGGGAVRRTMLLEHKRSEDMLGVYSIEPKVVGRGGYGTVRKATLTGSGKKLKRAVKEVRKRSLHSANLTQREIGVLRSLDHPNICRLFESYEDKKNIYLVLEFIEGRDLFDELQDDIVKRLTSETRFDEDFTAHIMRQVFSALAYCHGHGIIHRDIKLENIMVCQPEGPDADMPVVKIIDWGLAVISQAEGFRTQRVEGTKAYLAPEAREEGDFSPGSDMWSTGVVLHILLLGSFPTPADPHPVMAGTEALSLSALDLLEGLLKFNPAERLTAASALKHPWIMARDGVRSENTGIELRRQATSSFVSFFQAEKLRQAALTAVAMQISSDHLVKACAQFKAVDLNGDGVISKEEFLQAFKSSFVEGDAAHTHEQWVQACDAIFDEVDTDGSGEIEFTEWEAAALGNIDGISDEAIKAAFRVLDYDRSGKISLQNLARVVRQNSDEIANWLPQFDLNGDGEIDFDEFKAMFRTKAAAAAGDLCKPVFLAS